MNYPKYQIYNNFFDLDLYTLSMCLVVLNQFPRAYTKWEFFDRENLHREKKGVPDFPF